MNTLTQAYCKLACFQVVHRGKYNICHCFPYCKVLNNTLSNKSSVYIQGPYAKTREIDCSCIQTCKNTSVTINKPNCLIQWNPGRTMALVRGMEPKTCP